MKSLLISTAIILGLGLGASFLYRAFTVPGASVAMRVMDKALVAAPSVFQQSFSPPHLARLTGA